MDPGDAAAVRRYQARSRKQDRVAAIIDGALSLFLGRPAAASALPAPGRLLLCNFGHLGDLLMMNSLLPTLKKVFPGLHIGLLCGSWARPVVEDSPLFDQVHYLDHWHLDRRPVSLWRKICGYFRDFPAAVREIRLAGYDAAIAMRPWWPNAIPLLWFARIPVRLGYRKGGFSPLLTHCQEFHYDRRHELEYQIALLQYFPVEPALWATEPKVWMSATDNGHREVSALAVVPGRGRYAVLHPGASIELKNWTEDGWQKLAQRLIDEELIPVFTGLGPNQAALIRRLIPRDGQGVDLCDRLSWQGLSALVEQAAIVYCVDTSIGHLASALGTPCVAILGGMTDPLQWRPAGPFSEAVSHPVSCNPCFDKRGCSHLSCLRMVSVEDVWRAGKAAMERKRLQVG